MSAERPLRPERHNHDRKKAEDILLDHQRQSAPDYGVSAGSTATRTSSRPHTVNEYDVTSYNNNSNSTEERERRKLVDGFLRVTGTDDDALAVDILDGL